MAININKAIIMGRLGADPEVKGSSGFVTCRVATSESWKDKQTGERQERTQWHNVVVFNEHGANFLREYAKKGDTVCIEGQIETRKFLDRDNQERWVTEIVVPRFGGSVQLMSQGSTQSDVDRQEERRPKADVKVTTKPSQQSTRKLLDDEIPF